MKCVFALLIAEIEKRIVEHKKLLKEDNTLISAAILKGSLGAYESIERFITSLQPEQLEGLDEAADKYAKENCENYVDEEDGVTYIEEALRNTFKAGAEWMAGREKLPKEDEK